MQITVRFSEEYRNNKFIEEGVLPDREQEIQVDSTALTPDTRKVLVKNRISGDDARLDLTKMLGGYGYPSETVDYELDSDDIDPDELIKNYYARKQELLDAARAEADAKLRETIRVHRQRLEDGKAKLYDPNRTGMFIPNYASEDLKSEAHELEEEIKATLRERQLEWERKEREEAQAFKQDKLAWVAHHGSAHLKEACEAGYDCKRKYVTERAAMEHPEYTLDFDDQARWRDRACPSPEALAEAKRVGGKVVWLTTPPYELEENDDYYEPWEPREAVVIMGYLEHKIKRDYGLQTYSYELIREF